ncbi:MAG TPA: LPXTG cell wall anchor domain-containing protein [Micromonospora sp.]|nr:LPXTG cell wall anchor domain-containing protein [Micromonospora sp.]
MTIDFSDVADLVTLSTDDTYPECTTAGTTMTCTADETYVWGGDAGSSLFDLLIKPKSGAALGSSGKLAFRAEGDGYAAATHESTVRLAEGVDLAAGPEVEVTAKPGEAFTAPLTVRNAGRTVVNGAVAIFYNDWAIRSEKKFSNCRYVQDRLRSCHFDMPLNPGENYTASMPYRLGEDTYAPGFDVGEVNWMTVAEFDDYVTYLGSLGISLGDFGTGSTLALTAVPIAKARMAQVDTDPDNNWSHLAVRVTGKNGADLAALGARVAGGAGETITAAVGFRNLGPATIDATRSGSSITRIDVEIPAGTTAVGVPDDCAPMKDGEIDWEKVESEDRTGAANYRCHAGSFIAVDETETVEFSLLINEVIADATGLVRINAECACEGFADDTNPANDTAQLIVNPTKGSEDGDDGEGGAGGGLPVTGATTGIIAGAGVLLLAAGMIGFVLARRRRMRFVA